MRHAFLLVSFVTGLLIACSPTTPLFVMQVTTGEVAEYKQTKNNRLMAALEEEGDLLTYSLKAIRDNQSATAERLFLAAYDDHRYGKEVRAIALYQIALIYMNRYNDQRDDSKAEYYFQRIDSTFPQTHIAQLARMHLETLRQRKKDPIQKTARELLAEWKPQQAIDVDKPTFDPDLNILSRRAILKGRSAEAERLYLLLVDDPAISGSIKEISLYQIALIYLSADNPDQNRNRAANFLRRLLADYPYGKLNDKVQRHLDQVLNMQP